MLNTHAEFKKRSWTAAPSWFSTATTAGIVSVNHAYDEALKKANTASPSHRRFNANIGCGSVVAGCGG